MRLEVFDIFFLSIIYFKTNIKEELAFEVGVKLLSVIILVLVSSKDGVCINFG